MNYNLLIPLLVTTTVAILGWFAAHQLTAARDRANKRRDLRVQYLLDAYRKLEAASNRECKTEADARQLESAVADIYLFGTSFQVSKVKEFVETFAQTGGASTDSLLADLRRDLRRELRMEAVADGVKYLRITVNEGKASSTHLQSPVSLPLRPIGLCAGEFTVPQDFDAPMSPVTFTTGNGEVFDITDAPPDTRRRP